MDIRWFLWIISALQWAVVVLGFSFESYSAHSENKFTCGKCEPEKCPDLVFCYGEVIKDHCNCCTRCSSDKFQPHIPLPLTAAAGDDACAKVECPRFKVCMRNIQGLPLCICPSSYICRRGKKKAVKKDKSLCGSDGVTYESRCHMRIADCNSGKRIKRLHKGPCSPEEQAIQPAVTPEKTDVTTDVNTLQRIQHIVKWTNKKDRKKRRRRKRRHFKNPKSNGKSKRSFSFLKGKKSKNKRYEKIYV